MRLVDRNDDQPKQKPIRDLLCGVTPWHIYKLCDNPFNGGRGYTPAQVGGMTLDQIMMLLGDDKVIRKGHARETPVSMAEVRVGEDGLVAGRDAHGNAIRAKVRGQSLASVLAEQEARGEH